MSWSLVGQIVVLALVGLVVLLGIVGMCEVIRERRRGE